MHYYSAATSKIPNGEIFTSNGVIFTNHPLPAYMNPTYCHNTTLFCSSCYYKETNRIIVQNIRTLISRKF